MDYRIDANGYRLEISYQENSSLRRRLDSLAQATFGGLSFEAWYQAGYWQDKTIPYTLFDGENAVANVFVSLFDTVWKGQKNAVSNLGRS